MERRGIRKDTTEREIHDLGEHILLFQGYFSDDFREGNPIEESWMNR